MNNDQTRTLDPADAALRAILHDLDRTYRRYLLKKARAAATHARVEARRA